MRSSTNPDGQILWERGRAVAVGLIDRPARRNALNAELCLELRTLLEGNRDLRCVVLGGTGDRSFCAGADLVRRAHDSSKSVTTGGPDEFRISFDSLLDAIEEFPAPVIAAVNGHALGAGMQLAVACDLRVASPNAAFGIPAGKLGIVISPRNVQRLVHAVGYPLAKDLLFTARSLSLDEAASVGLVQRKAIDALEAAQELAEEIAELAPLSARAHKVIISRIAEAAGLSEGDQSRLHALEKAAFASKDYREGLAAFASKRSPVFRGQ